MGLLVDDRVLGERLVADFAELVDGGGVPEHAQRQPPWLLWLPCVGVPHTRDDGGVVAVLRGGPRAAQRGEVAVRRPEVLDCEHARRAAAEHRLAVHAAVDARARYEVLCLVAPRELGGRRVHLSERIDDAEVLSQALQRGDAECALCLGHHVRRLA